MSELLEVDDGFVFAVWHDVLVFIWRSPTTMVGATRAGVALAELGSRHPEGFGLMVVIQASVGVPEAEVREVIARDMKRYERSMRAAAIVCEGEGFTAAAARAVALGIHRIALLAMPADVVTTVGEAASFLSHHGLLRSERIEDLVAFVEEARNARRPPGAT